MPRNEARSTQFYCLIVPIYRYLVRVNITWVLQLEPYHLQKAMSLRMRSEEILTLSNIAETHPHSACIAFTHHVMHRWNYVMHTIESVGAFSTTRKKLFTNTSFLL